MDVLHGLRRREPAADFVVIAENEATRSRFEETLRRLDDTDDVVLLDAGVMLPNRVRDARGAYPTALLIAAISDSARHRVRGAVLNGADGVVLRESLEQTLGATIAAARVGQLVVPRAASTAAYRPQLSTREKQVLGMVVLGFTNGEIARKLVLAESTIKSHLSSAFTKLGVRSRSEAAAMILDSESGLGTGILAISVDERSGDG